MVEILLCLALSSCMADHHHHHRDFQRYDAIGKWLHECAFEGCSNPTPLRLKLSFIFHAACILECSRQNEWSRCRLSMEMQRLSSTRNTTLISHPQKSSDIGSALLNASFLATIFHMSSMLRFFVVPSPVHMVPADPHVKPASFQNGVPSAPALLLRVS